MVMKEWHVMEAKYVTGGVGERGFPGTTRKEPACQCRRHKKCRFHPCGRKGIATHSSILAWRIPWREEPGGLQSMGFQRVGHD